jgi:DNA-directed RNA polymerase sigma subunit (sigma70/sigma32)
MGTRKATPAKLRMREIREKLRVEMLWLKRSGLTLGQIGTVYGISKQRVHQILKEGK